jgi:uncharacterized membrane protein
MTPLEVAVLILGILAIVAVVVAIAFYIFVKSKFRGAPLLAPRVRFLVFQSSFTHIVSLISVVH